MKKLILPFALCALLIISCGEKEDYYAIEQKEIDAYLASEGLDFYKAFKVSLRGTKMVGQDPVFDSARSQLCLFVGYGLQLASDTAQSMQEVIRAGTAVYEAESAVEILIQKDEDTLPTVMENIYFVMNALPSDTGYPMFTESEEHLILAGLWVAGAHAHPGLALYEMNRIKADDIRDPQFRLLSEMTRSLLYLTHDWPYHAVKSADDFLAMTESEKNALMTTPWPGVDANGNAVTPEQAWHQVRAIGYVLRAAAHDRCEEQDMKDAAQDDLIAFVEEAELGGMDHEVVDYAGLAIALKTEDNDMAAKYIERLESRSDLSQDEKELIAEIKTYVNDNQHEDAQNAMNENSLMAGALGRLFADQFMDLPVVKELETSETGKKFIEITRVPLDDYMPGTDAIDSLAKDAEGLMDKVF